MIPVPTGIHHAVRRLGRAPAFTVAAVLTLTLGIGATSAVFSVINAVLLRPLPYPAPSRLVDLSHTLAISGISHVDQSDATYLYYARANRVFSGVAAYRSMAVNLAPAMGARAGEAARAEHVTAAGVSASTFTVLGAAPLRGRAVGEADDRPGATPVVAIGQRLWERKYGADPAIVGRRVEIDGIAREVVGIMPESFAFPTMETALWLPLALDPANTKSAAFDYRAVARLRPGVTLDAATADLQRLLPRVPETFPGRLSAAAIEQTDMRAVVRPLRDVIVGDVGRVLWIVLGAMGFVLLIACANVANLFLVRAEGRAHELAVRRALGGGRRTIMAGFLTEGFIVAAAGGVLGLALAAVGVRVLRSHAATVGIPRLGEVGIDGAVIGVAAAITIFTTLLVSGWPALRSAAVDLSAVLAANGRSATTGRGRSRVRQALVVAQVALALMLLTGAGLMARSFAHLRGVQPGFDASHVFMFRVALGEHDYAAPGAAARMLVRALDQIAALPGVRSAGVVTALPLDAEARRDTALFVEDQPVPMGDLPNIHHVAFATPGYFSALRIPIIEGRAFEPPEPDRVRREVIVSRALAMRYWADGRATGRRVRMAPTGPWYTIVGVTGDVHGDGLDQPVDETIYLPLVVALDNPASDAMPGPSWTPRGVAIVVRGAARPASLAARTEGVIRALDPAVPVYRARAMTDVVADASARTAFTVLLLGIASAAALALGAVGIYGVISYVVSLRAREIAIRLAIGARPTDVRRMVSRQALTMAAGGIGVGLIGSMAVTRILAALLFGVDPIDPATMALAAGSLLLVAVAASWLPARRAAGVDPARTLRAD